MRMGLAIVGLGMLVVGGSDRQGASVASPTSAQQIFVPPGTEQAYDAVHYAPVVRVGDTVILSGVAAVGPGDFETQLRRMFDRIKSNLAAAGASMADVVELQTFHRGGPDSAAFQAEFRRVRAIHDEYFAGHYPAWTAVGNVTLLSPDALVETRVMAVIGSGANVSVHRESRPPTAGTPQAPAAAAPGGGAAGGRPDPALLAPHRIDLADAVTVPAQLLYGNRPTVDAMINGHGPFHLSIETGGPYALAISAKMAATLGLEPVEGPLQMWDVDALQIGAMTLRDLKARPSPNDVPFPGADGLLGLAAYRDLLLTIDYPAATVTFSRGGLGEPDGQQTFPLETVGPLLAARADVAGHPTPLVVDTQSGGLTVMCHPTIAGAFPFADAPVTVGQAVVSGLVSQPQAVQEARLSGSIRLGRFSLERPLIEMASMPPGVAGLGPICTMGSELLSNFRVTLDEHNRRFRLDRTSAVVPAPPSTFSLGVTFESPDPSGRVHIKAVAVDGAAAQAGLQAGDEVQAIDGHPATAESTGTSALGRLAQRESTVRISVVRNGRVVECRLSPKVLVR